MRLWYNKRMSKNTNKESKGILAKLLATEGISVTHSVKAETAMFDVKNRQLVLPMWSDMTDDIYDMLVGHEVGHALFTPYDQEKESKIESKGPWNADAQEIGGDSHGHIAMAYLNIIEDARIEKLMKLKYPGLRRDFVSAYAKLDARDFFGAHAKAPKHLIDRINLHFKMGVSAETSLNVQFSPTEMVFVDRIAASETYDDVVQIVKDLWEYEIENSNNPKESPEYVSQDGEDDGESNGEQGEKKDSKSESDTNGGIKASKGGSKQLTAPAMAETHNNYLENCKTLVSDDITDVSYVSLPVPNLKNIIITPKEIDHIMSAYKSNDPCVQTNRAAAVVETQKFIRSSNKSVAILVKQFEMKKAADAHKRSSTAKTGILDTVKMMKYRFDDDIFLRSLTIRDGKNHGIVMFVDWSSSMTNIIDDTVRQCFLIALFCKKCNIPFEVYAFSSVHIRADLNLGRSTDKSWDDHYNVTDNEVIQADSWSKANGDRMNRSYEESGDDTKYLDFSDFSLLNFVSSKMSMKEMTSAMANMLQITSVYGKAARHSYYLLNPVLRLSGTPLNECVVAATEIVNQFKAKNNIQIVSTIMLTDGEGGRVGVRQPTSDHKSFVVNEKKKVTYDVGKIKLSPALGWQCTDTEVLLRIHSMETGSNLLGFYLNESASMSGSRMLDSFLYNPQGQIHTYGMTESEKKKIVEQGDLEAQKKVVMSNSYKKDGYFVAEIGCRMGGYKELYVIRGSAMMDTSEDTIGELQALDKGSSVTAVRTAFRKQMKESVMCKNLLNRIIDNICV